METRFSFGKNWQRFLRLLDKSRIYESERSLEEFIPRTEFKDKTFLDVGSGSGLSSLSARNFGSSVHSFDYDSNSVDCTREVRDRFYPDDRDWKVEQGSILDQDYLKGLGQFDIVYSWGVLHHTGDMWQSLDNIISLVKPEGLLFIAIYNDCDEISRWWHKRKKTYCDLPNIFKPLYFIWIWGPIEIRSMFAHFRRNKLKDYFRQWSEYKKSRGMSRLYDMIDWLGGYPYEFAKLNSLITFYEEKGFKLLKYEENNGYGCHQIVFRKSTY